MDDRTTEARLLRMGFPMESCEKTESLVLLQVDRLVLLALQMDRRTEDRLFLTGLPTLNCDNAE